MGDGSRRAGHPHQRCGHPRRCLGPDPALLRGARPAHAVALHRGRRAPLHDRRPGPPAAHPRAARGARHEPRRDPRVPRARDEAGRAARRRTGPPRAPPPRRRGPSRRPPWRRRWCSTSPWRSRSAPSSPGWTASGPSSSATPGAAASSSPSWTSSSARRTPALTAPAPGARPVVHRVSTLGSMAYDEDLAERIRALVATERGLSEKKMFGGIAFLVGGNMAIAASGQGGILVRVDPDSRTSSWQRRRRRWPSCGEADGRVAARRRTRTCGPSASWPSGSPSAPASARSLPAKR